MKKYFLLSLLISGSKLFAQIPEDALRYSWYPQNGTARNLAIGGAMGSLGGDITAAYVNPAGLGFFKTNEFVVSPGFLLNNNKATFRETNSNSKKNGFNLGPVGVILAGTSDYNKNTSGALSLSLMQTANFNNRISYGGLNNVSSFSETFAEEFSKSNYTIDEILNENSPRPFGAAPALYNYLIDTATVNGQTVITAATDNILDAGQALRQQFDKTTSGGIYEAAIGFGINKNEKWLFGGTLGIPIAYYKSNTTFSEADTSGNTSNGFSAMSYNDQFTTYGVGLNVKLGAIYRPKEYIRIGLALHSPSFMWLRDERTAILTTKGEGAVYDASVSSELFTNNQPGINKYIQSSPWKAIFSGSYVFRETEDVTKQRAFVTADIEYVNHKGSRFSDNNRISTDQAVNDSYTKELNSVVKEIYKGAFNFRAGGELKFNTIMARLGFAHYGNPYKNGDFKADKTLLSTGLGYRNKGFFIDVTYIHNITKDANFPYRLDGQPNTYAVTNQQQNNIVTTFGWKF